MIGEANARQNTNNHKKIAAQSLENDENHAVRFQSSNFTSAASVSKNKTVERYGRANREMKKKKKERKKTPLCQYTIEKVS